MPPKAQPKAGAKPAKKTKKQIEEENRLAMEVARKSSDADKVASVQRLSLSVNQSINKANAEKHSISENANRLISEAIVSERHKLKRILILKEAVAHLEEVKDWKEFISCSGEPNVHSQKDIMRYVANITEGVFPTDNGLHDVSIDQALRCIDDVESVVSSINICKLQAAQASDDIEATWYLTAINSLRASASALLNSAIACMLRNAEKLGPNARQEVQGQWTASTGSIGFWGILNSKGFRSKSIEFARVQLSLEIPKTICSHCPGMIGVRIHNTRVPSVDDSGDKIYSVSAYLSVEVVSIPEAARVLGGWAIRLVDDDSDKVSIKPYPNAEASAAPAQPCKVIWRLPGDLLCEPRPALWTGTLWSHEHVSEVKYDAGTLSFVTSKLGLFGLTQSRCVNPPWKQWLLRPVGEAVQLLVEIENGLVTFDIDEKGVRCEQYSVASTLPGQVLDNLEKRGLSLKPETDGDRFGAVEISDFCLTCDFWRKKGGVLKMRPNHRGEQFDWLGNAEEFAEFQTVTISSKLDTVTVDGGSDHASLRQCLELIPAFKTAVGKAAVTRTTALIMDNVKVMLCLLDLN